MKVIKRDGTAENVSFDKITNRISRIMEDESMGPVIRVTNDHPEPVLISQKVCSSIVDGIHTKNIDDLVATVCAGLSVVHPGYDVLAGRLLVEMHQSATDTDFFRTVQKLYDDKLVSQTLYKTAKKHAREIQDMLCPDRDFLINYFGMRTLMKSYLMRRGSRNERGHWVKGEHPIERPMHMWMRVALSIHLDDMERVKETYDNLSMLRMTHATPTLFNAGSTHQQMASCFLVGMEDSLAGIYKTLTDCAHISKWAGGVGICLSDIRSRGSPIRTTNGQSDGIMNVLKTFNATSRHINQAGKRRGSFAVYLEPWHADVFEFLDAKKNNGGEEERARDLFYALWVPDLFMKRVRDNGDWCLMCPHMSPGLTECYGSDFEELYCKYESEGRFVKRVPAQTVWDAIISSQIETGNPYILYKDACNSKSNQKNLGTIKCSNLCAEIVEYTSKDEISVCNLGSIALPRFVIDKSFDFHGLGLVVESIVRNLDLVIDRGFYPVPESKKSNTSHRPVGLGVQGLADVFSAMGLAFDSPDARNVNRRIFKTMYFHAMKTSHALAVEKGAYASFEGSPLSLGKMQYHLWGKTTTEIIEEDEDLDLDWVSLERNVQKGVRNSLLIAVMPTATTSQILGNTESIEPVNTNIYTRKTLAGEFTVINKHLSAELIKNNRWSPDVIDRILYDQGSVQRLDIPANVKSLFKTAWELKQKSVLDQAIDRAPYVCQTQSMNVFLEDPSYSTLTKLHFYGWRNGLKTGSYYVRTRPAMNAQNYAMAPEKEKMFCQDESECTMCSA